MTRIRFTIQDSDSNCKVTTRSSRLTVRMTSDSCNS